MLIKLIDKLLILLFSLMIFIFFTGGFIIRIGKAKIEFASMGAWAIVALLLAAILALIFKRTDLISFKLYDRVLSKLSQTKTFYYLLLFFVLIFIIGHFFRHWSVNTDGADVSFVNQSLAYLFSDIPFKCDLCLNKTFLGEHLAFTFYLLSFFSWIKSDELIIVFQILFSLSSIYYFITQGPIKFNKSLWAVLFICILGHITLKNALFWDFREDHLGMGFYLIFITLFFNKRFKLSYVFFLLTLLSKENFSFILIFFPLIIMLEPQLQLTKFQRYFFSFILIFTCLAWIFLTFKILLPYFNKGIESGNNIVSRFPELGKTPKEVILCFISKPILVIDLLKKRLLHASTFKYVSTLIFPFLFFTYKRWYWLLATIPVLMMNLLSFNFDQRMLIFHYDLMMFPLLIFPLAIEFKTLRINSKKIFWGILIVFVFSSKWPTFFVFKYLPSMSDIKNISFFNNIPNTGIIGSNQRVMGQTSHLYEQRCLRIPPYKLDLNNPDNWDLYWFWNTRLENPRDRVNKDVTYMILDKNIPWESFLITETQKRNWEIVTISSDARFFYMRKVNAQ